MTGPPCWVNGVQVKRGDMIAGNAIIHEVGGLLLPPGLAELLGNSETTTIDTSDDLGGLVMDPWDVKFDVQVTKAGSKVGAYFIDSEEDASVADPKISFAHFEDRATLEAAVETSAGMAGGSSSSGDDAVREPAINASKDRLMHLAGGAAAAVLPVLVASVLL